MPRDITEIRQRAIEEIERISGELARAREAAAPAERIAELERDLAAAEKKSYKANLFANGTLETMFPGNKGVHQLFKDHAKKIGVSAKDLAKAYYEKFGDAFRKSNVETLNRDGVVRALEPYALNVRDTTPSPERGRARVEALPPTETDRAYRNAMEAVRRNRERRAAEGRPPVVPAGAGRVDYRQAMEAARRGRDMRTARREQDILDYAPTPEDDIESLRFKEKQALELAELKRERAVLAKRDPEALRAHKKAFRRAMSLGVAKRKEAEEIAYGRTLLEHDEAAEESTAALRRDAERRAARAAEYDTVPDLAAKTIQSKPLWIAGPHGLMRGNLEKAHEITSRPYKKFPGAKIEPLTPLQEEANDLALLESEREAEKAKEYNDAKGLLARSADGTGYEAEAGTMAAAKAPSHEGVKAYMDPFIENVMDRLHRRALVNFNEKMIPHINKNLGMAGGLNAGRRNLIQQGYRDLQESLLDQESKLLSHGYGQALGQSSTDRERLLGAARVGGGLFEAGRERQAQAAAKMHDLSVREQGRVHGQVNALAQLGSTEHATKQAARDSEVADFEEEKKYPLAMVAAEAALLNQAPVSESTISVRPNASSVQQSPYNAMGNMLGAVSMLSAGRHNTGYNKGGRVKRAGGGLMMGGMEQPMDPYVEESEPDIDPLMRGASTARRMLDKYRSRMSSRAEQLDRPGRNPMYSMLGNMFAHAAASDEPYPLRALAKGMPAGMEAYERELERDDVRKARADNIHKAITDTYMIEEDTKVKNQLKREKMELESLNKKGHLAELERHHRIIEGIKARNSGKYVGSNTGSSSLAPGSSPAPLQTPNPVEMPPLLDLENDNEKRTKAKDETAAEIRFYDKALRHIDKMDENINNVGLSGYGKLGNRIATGNGLWGSMKDRSAYNSETSELVNLAAAQQGRTGSRSAAALRALQAAKPNLEDNDVEGNKEIHKNKRNAFMVDREAAKFRQKCLNKGIKDYVITETLSKWEETNPEIIEDGKVVGFSTKPEDLMPDQYKTLVGGSDSKKDPTSSLEAKKKALREENAKLAAQLAKKGR